MSLPPEYKDNPLIDRLGPIPDEQELAQQLIKRPPVPKHRSSIPRHLLVHHLASARHLHIPSDTGQRVASSIHFMIRQGYVNRAPARTETWRRAYRHPNNTRLKGACLAMFIAGCSGIGKTEAILQALDLFPQTIWHESFPHMADGLTQVPYLLVRVPPSGSAVDLGAALHAAMDKALGLPPTRLGKSAHERFSSFEQRARICFLGFLVLDEIGHLFKVATLEERRKAKAQGKEPGLRVHDDMAVKFVVYLSETAEFPLILCGTPDGMSMLSTRLAAAQRLTTAGCHVMRLPTEGDEFSNLVLEELLRYQVLPKALKYSNELQQTVFKYSAHIPRIRAALMLQAQLRAIERGADGLTIDDLHWAARNRLSPLIPAVEALRSGAPDALSRYEDVLPRDDHLWAKLLG